MTTSSGAAASKASSWSIWFPRVLWILSLGLVIVAITDFVRGVPDSYHNEKARSLSIALALFLGNVAQEFGPRPTGWILRIASGVAIGVTFWFTA